MSEHSCGGFFNRDVSIFLFMTSEVSLHIVQYPSIGKLELS